MSGALRQETEYIPQPHINTGQCLNLEETIDEYLGLPEVTADLERTMPQDAMGIVVRVELSDFTFELIRCWNLDVLPEELEEDVVNLYLLPRETIVEDHKERDAYIYTVLCDNIIITHGEGKQEQKSISIVRMVNPHWQLIHPDVIAVEGDIDNGDKIEEFTNNLREAFASPVSVITIGWLKEETTNE